MATVLITGGSSGIGLEMSRIWGQNGYRLLWVSHKNEELVSAKALIKREIPNVDVLFQTIDLTDDDGPERVHKWATEVGKVDVVINNAGFGTYGFVNEISLEQELSMIKLNAIGLYKMTRLFLKDMLLQNKGTIINICSNSAFQPIPRMTTYAATKGFVYQFSRGLQQELFIQKSAVRVMTVCPAAISDTPFRKLLSQDVQTFKGLAATTAIEVANDVWKGFSKNKSFVVSGKKMRLLYRLRVIIPPFLTRYLVRKETEPLLS